MSFIIFSNNDSFVLIGLPRSLEFDRLSAEHSELQQTSAKLAERVFELKIRAESLALPIRRFLVQLVSPSLLMTPAQV
jgi:hypothetical protein